MTAKNLSRWAVAAAALVAVGLACAQSAPGPAAKPSAAPKAPGLAAVTPAQFGESFPTARFVNLNGAPGQPPSVDLAAVLGKRPVVFVYWMAQNPRAEKILLETQSAVEAIGADKLTVLSFAAPAYGSTDTEPIRTRASALGLRCPVLYDEGFRVLQQLNVHAVPNIAVIDGEGKLRLANGGSLKQTLEYKLDLEGALKRVATTGKLGTYGALAQYYPVTELVGKKCPDFDAPLVNDPVSRSFSSMLSSDKVNVLVFWSVDCPHCKVTMPRLNDWLKTNPAGMNVISAARVTDDATKTRTSQYCKISGFVFPTLVDKDLQIASAYQVVSTPTVVVIRPDGVVDSVLLSGESDLAKALEEKKRSILKSPPSKG